MATEIAGVGEAGGQGHVSLRSIVPVECKWRTSGPDGLTPAHAGGVSGPPAVHVTGAWPLGVWHRPPVQHTPV